MATANNRKSMSQIMPLDKAKPPTHKAIEYLNQPLVLIDFDEIASAEQYRKIGNESYYIIKVVPAELFPIEDEDYVPIHITIGGFTMRKQLKAINRAEDMPLDIVIKLDPTDKKTLFME